MMRLGPHVLAFVLFASGAPAAVFCDSGPRAAAQSNAGSLKTMKWIPFGRPETGWEVYGPLIAQEIGTTCAATTPGFAASVATWQNRYKLANTGVLDDATFAQMKQVWQQRRPFLATAKVTCPLAPQEAALSQANPDESYRGKQIQLQTAALAAYRKMVAAAREEVSAIAADPRLLTIFSGYRSPSYDAERCAREQNCQGIVRAACSAHWTGLAMDMYLGSAPGYQPDSTDDPNRLYLSQSVAYLWLVHNAQRFGFVNYAFEPWHWEWAGETQHK